MQSYLSRIKKIKQEIEVLQKEIFEVAVDGTRHKVFLSNKYAIRFRDDRPELLLREVSLLKQLGHSLIPKILWENEIGGSFAAVENRIPGRNINIVWKNLPKKSQTSIIRQIIKFLRYLRTQTRDNVYSVNTGETYNHFSDYLTDVNKNKIDKIKKVKKTDGILRDLLSVVRKTEAERLFLSEEKVTLVHGDLIVHNLLTDGRNLTGVLDWESALFGDPDYDIFRLFYYQECAQAYREQDIDEAFEADYMDKLTTAILKSNLIKNKKLFWEKYKFIRATFYLDALCWASNSKKFVKNIDELVVQWNIGPAVLDL